MSFFKPGEIAVLHLPGKSCHGEECTLIEEYYTHWPQNCTGRIGQGWLIEWRGKVRGEGESERSHYFAFDDQLRKRYLPGDSWQLIRDALNDKPVEVA